MNASREVKALRCLVVKLGTGILTAPGGTVDRGRIDQFAEDIAAARASGARVAVVSSGAVGMGMGRLGLSRRPRDLARIQACAAVGQSMLIETWQAAFKPHGLTVAQVLLTREDIRGRSRHLGVLDLLNRLLDSGIVPIINENDSISTAEIQFGDNDILAALVASMIKAELLVILSTAPGLVDRYGTGETLRIVERITPEIEAMAGGSESTTSVGGMRAKVEAARVATRSGCGVCIADGRERGMLTRILRGEAIGTFFAPAGGRLASRKRWMAFFERPSGTIQVDPGARTALLEKGRSLLAMGIVAAEGGFTEGSVVNLSVQGNPQVFARGITRFDREAIERIAGKPNEAIRELFPGRKRLEVIHRDSLVLLESPPPPVVSAGPSQTVD